MLSLGHGGDVLLYGGDVLGVELALGEQLRGDPPLEQQPLLGHLYQDEAHQLTHVHATHHLLEAGGRSTASQIHNTHTGNVPLLD